MNYGWLNLGSLLLGLAAWACPVIYLIKRNRTQGKDCCIFTMISVSACAVSLFFQIVYQDYLVRIEDLSALMDTSHATVAVSAVLLAITLALNLITVFVYSKDRRKQA